jgi:hypothetical protein
MKRTDNMGAKFIAFEATIMAFSNFENLDPESCVHVRENCTKAYKQKYMHERIIVQATAGDTGGIFSPGQMPFGGT